MNIDLNNISAAILCVTWFANASTAQPVDAMTIFQDSWAKAQQFTLPENVHIKFHEMVHSEMTDREFRELQSRIAGKPDHPERRTADPEARRRANGPDRIDHEIWFRGPGRWRYNMTDHGQGFYVDIATTDGVAWSMVPNGALSVISTASEPPPNKNYPATEVHFTRRIKEFAWGRIGAGVKDQMLPRESVIDGGAWTGVASDPARVTWKGAGVVSPGPDHRVLLHRSEVTQSLKMPAAVGEVESHHDWSMEPLLGEYIARRVTELSPAGRQVRTCVVDEINALDAAAFSRLVEVPPFNGDDPVRGKTTFTSIVDFRPDVEKIRVMQNGEVTDMAIPAAALPSGRTIWVRTAGWIIAAMIVVVLVFMRMSRTRALRSGHRSPVQ